MRRISGLLRWMICAMIAAWLVAFPANNSSYNVLLLLRFNEALNVATRTLPHNIDGKQTAAMVIAKINEGDGVMMSGVYAYWFRCCYGLLYYGTVVLASSNVSNLSCCCERIWDLDIRTFTWIRHGNVLGCGDTIYMLHFGWIGACFYVLFLLVPSRFRFNSRFSESGTGALLLTNEKNSIWYFGNDQSTTTTGTHNLHTL